MTTVNEAIRSVIERHYLAVRQHDLDDEGFARPISFLGWTATESLIIDQVADAVLDEDEFVGRIIDYSDLHDSTTPFGAAIAKLVILYVQHRYHKQNHVRDFLAEELGLAWVTTPLANRLTMTITERCGMECDDEL